MVHTAIIFMLHNIDIVEVESTGQSLYSTLE